MKKIIWNIFFYLFLFILTSYVFVAILIPDKTMDIFHIRTYIIVSPSMDPVLNVNDLVFVIKADESELEVGDIITFKTYIRELDADSYVTHYIGAIQNSDDQTIYKTQGEGQAAGDYDEWVNSDLSPDEITFNDIEGKYLFKVPYIGNVISFFNDPILLALLFGNIIIVVVIVKYVKNIRKEKKHVLEEKQDKEEL
ncbi:MAG: signal peptidase I [Tenericutes bacterium]|nr:signal peptidase I [Mycoplasmatota bacterium]